MDFQSSPPYSAASPSVGSSTDPNGPKWTAFFTQELKNLQTPGDPDYWYRFSVVTEEEDWVLSGEVPDDWVLSGNRQNGSYDWDIWTRFYPKIVVRRLLRIQVDYHGKGRILTSRVYYVWIGSEVQRVEQTCIVEKLASYHKKAGEVAVGVQIGQKIAIGVGGNITVTDQYDIEVHVPPTRNRQPSPPPGGRFGDPAELLSGH
jgi:hypothetical protein